MEFTWFSPLRGACAFFTWEKKQTKKQTEKAMYVLETDIPMEKAEYFCNV